MKMKKASLNTTKVTDCKGRHGHNKSSGNHRRRHKIKALDFAVIRLVRIERRCV